MVGVERGKFFFFCPSALGHPYKHFRVPFSAVKYNWFKESAYSFVRPEYQTYQFISQNGKLYFSEVTRADEGRYHCIAILTGVNRYTIGTSQPPTRTSLGIQLHVHDQGGWDTWQIF